MRTINHVAVIGSGIMGGGIAAFFANQGITSDMYDISLELALENLKKLANPKAKIPLLYTPRFAKKIKPRVLDDMEKQLSKADLIIEVVPEKMELKKKTFAKIDEFRKQDSIVTTNTSGLSVNKMIEGCSRNLSENFLGTHYFNPVRFLPLVEIIPATKTQPDIVDFMEKFLSKAGKKTIICQDTPNFVANRIGTYSLMKVLQLMQKYRFDVETVDMITGTPLGNPKSATLRLCDMVGIDTVYFVAKNLYDNCPDDDERDLFDAPDFFKRLVEEKKLGEKTGEGFYRRVSKGVIEALNIETWEYATQKKTKSDIVKVAKSYQDIAERLRSMVKGEEAINKFCRELLLSTAAYSIKQIGKIAEDIVTIDNGMQWGFNRELGPIEILDCIGLSKSIQWMRDLSIKVPETLTEIESSAGKIYEQGYHQKCFNLSSKSLEDVPKRKGIISINALKHSGKTICENLSARLLDLDDGAILLEIDSRMVPTMNPVDEFVISMIMRSFEVIPKGGCLIVSNQGQNFCAGANLQLILEMCHQKAWDKIEETCSAFQNANMALYHADFPVIIAPHGMTLGGGMEITLTGHKRVAAAELYGGLVEVGVGLLPGGAGNLLLLMQFIDSMAKANPGPVVPVQKALGLIAYGKVSSSAHDAISKGFLQKTDEIVLDKEEQIKRAKEVGLEMVKDFKPRQKREIILPGTGGYLPIENMVDGLLAGGNIPPHGATIAKKMAYVLTGGEKSSPVNPVSEDYVLELEREAFLQLCGEEKSQQRIGYMLKNKKPLLN